MIVMPTNNTGILVGYLVGQYPGRLGHLFSPEGLRKTYDWMPFSLDNGKFACWSRGKQWDEAAYRDMLAEVSMRDQQPLWALVPDEVANPKETKRLWDHWFPVIKSYGWSVGFAVQDGMTKDDVPPEADVIFVGGSTEWKWATMHRWCQEFPRVHVGRVNSPEKLWDCTESGAESCDGTGWFRGNPKQTAGLIEYLDRVHQGKPRPGTGKLWT
jgi:hypothetical protein